MKFIKYLIGTFVCFFVCMLALVPIIVNDSLPNSMIVNYDISKFHKKGLLSAKYIPSNDTTATATNFSKGQLQIKYFGINVKNIDVYKVENDEIYACGKTVGVALQSKGVVVIGQNPIITKNGKEIICSNINVGDIICEIEGEYVETADSVSKIINDEQYKGKELVAKYKRDGKVYYTTIKPKLDMESQTYKLGLWVRDDASGIGTMTYVKSDTLEFGALGHPISDIDTGAIMDVFDGQIYKCSVLSIEKGSRGQAGQMRGIFVQSQNSLGSVSKNTNFGIFGKTTNDMLQYCKKVKIGGRNTAKAGKATILCSLDGKNIEEFDIDIIKTSYKGKNSNKSLVFKVTDKDLIQRTGGIIQGMSGSPIIQNGRLIGAVTHVFLNDATKGFGVYLDLMLENS